LAGTETEIPDLRSDWNVVFSNISSDQERHAARSVPRPGFKKFHTCDVSCERSPVRRAKLERCSHLDEEVVLGLLRNEDKASSLDGEGAFDCREEFHGLSTKGKRKF